MDKVSNAWIRKLCKMTKRVDERIDEGVLQWFGHVERMKNDRIAKKVYVGECVVSHSVGRLRKRWTDIVMGRLKEKRFECQASKENGT